MRIRRYLSDRFEKKAIVLFAIVGSLLSGREASASPLQYSTLGWVYPSIDSTTGSATSPIKFEGVNSGSLDGSTPFLLGRFVVGSVVSPDVTFNNVPFAVGVEIPSYGRTVSVPAPPGSATNYPTVTHYDPGFSITGRLNGQIIDGRPDLVATIDGVSPFGGAVYPADGAIVYGLPFPMTSVNTASTFAINSVGADGGSAPLMAQIVPEPAAVFAFLAGVAGTIVRSLKRRRPC